MPLPLVAAVEREIIMDEYPPITKESLISGILTLYVLGDVSEEVLLDQIKKFATDERLAWK